MQKNPQLKTRPQTSYPDLKGAVGRCIVTAENHQSTLSTSTKQDASVIKKSTELDKKEHETNTDKKGKGMQ